MASSSSSLLPSSPLPSSSASAPDSPPLKLHASSPLTYPHFGSAVPITVWNIDTNTCHTFNEDPPEYITLSHSYKDGTDDSRLEFITNVAKKHGVRYVWLDSYCMGETQDEVSRSVESMFKYYQGAEFCCLWLGT
ncbi:vegetative incompatibility protein het-e-1 [Colletotrichum chrysophilum]|uniref:Vegetative incompatibility protein het-e-1 n=1 Tax=Colletotrichum chrysophilum TaxID=1836956 RepID=A0AAD9EMV1_9PEZI|nr:vegetative incompatibility protein het-e-1 [Colletotrichum chrysophilum]